MTDTRKKPDTTPVWDCTCGHLAGMSRGHPSRCPLSKTREEFAKCPRP